MNGEFAMNGTIPSASYLNHFRPPIHRKTTATPRRSISRANRSSLVIASASRVRTELEAGLALDWLSDIRAPFIEKPMGKGNLWATRWAVPTFPLASGCDTGVPCNGSVDGVPGHPVLVPAGQA